MRQILPVLAALWIAVIPAQAAMARPLESDEANSLKTALKAYDGALVTGNSAALVAAIPPRIVAMIAGQSGMELAALQQALAEQSSAVMAGSVFSELTVDLPAAQAAEGRLSDGTQVLWALVPARFVLERDGKRVLYTQTILALHETDTWYLMRMEDPQQRDLVAAVYPFLAGIEITPTTATPIP